MYLQQKLGISQSRACRVIEQPRSTQRYKRSRKTDEDALRSDIIGLATKYGRYGYRRITALLRSSGWRVNHKRVERIWRQEGLKVPKKQPKRARLWLNDGSCVRLRPTHRNHVWSYDFVMDRTHSLLPGQFVDGWIGLVSKPPLSSLAVRGKTVTIRALTASSGMSCSTGRVFTISKKPRLSSRTGGKSTIALDRTAVLTIGRQHQRLSSR